MKTILQLFFGAVMGLVISAIVWLGLVLDDAEIKQGKSPHSGFTPESPTWEPPVPVNP